MMKKILILIVFAVFVGLTAERAHAAAYLAGNVLGQLDANGNRIFSLGNADNGVNNEGLNTPEGVAVDVVNHRLFVSDFMNNRILVFTLDVSNNISTRTATYVLGQADFTSSGANRNGAVSSDTLSGPWGLAYDSANSRLFASDQANQRVLVFDVSTLTNGKPAAYVLGQANFTSNAANRGGTLASSTLSSPSGIAYDSQSSRLFVNDQFNNRVLVFNVATSTIQNGKPASYVLGQPDFVSSNSGVTSSTFQGAINSVAYDPTNSRLFVSDPNGRVLIFNVATSTIQNGVPASNVLGKTNFTTGGIGATSSSTFQQAQALAYDASGSRLFVSSNENRTLVFYVPIATTTNGQPASYVLGQSDFTSLNPATLSSSSQQSPDGLTYDSVNSRLFVSDGGNNRILSYNVSSLSNGASAADVLGHLDANGGANFNANSANNAPNSKGFSVPSGVALDTVHHRLFVADSSNNRTSVFNLDSNNNLANYIMDNVLGQADFVSNLSSVPPTAQKINAPISVAYDSKNDRLFVSDGWDRVLVFNTATISDNMSASYVIGQTNFASSSLGVTSSTLNSNPILEYDTTHDRLFLTDTGNHRVLIFNAAPAQMSNGMPASYVLGEPNFTTVAPGTSSSTFNNPLGLAYDSTHDRLFVVDNNNSRVLGFNLASVSNGMPASYVLGQAGFNNATSGTSATLMNFPTDLHYDQTSGSLFVTDTSNNRILVFDTNVLQSGMAATGVLGQPDFVSSNASTSQTGLSGPYSLDYDSQNERLYTTDQNNNRVMIYNFITLSTSTLANGTSGSAYSQTIGSYNSQGTVAMSLYSGSLPPGLTISTAGLISGTPSAAGSYSFAVSASDTVPFIGYFLDPTNYTITIADSAPAATPSHGGETFADLHPGIIYGASSAGSTIISTTTTAATTTTVTSTPISTAPIQGVSTPKLVIRAFSGSFHLGQSDSQIKELQKLLNGRGYVIAKSGAGSPGQETNYYGLLTRKAVCKFQVENDIVASSKNSVCGIFGPKTRALVNKLLK